MDRDRTGRGGAQLPLAGGVGGPVNAACTAATGAVAVAAGARRRPPPASIDSRRLYVRPRTIATPAAYTVAALSVAYAIVYLGFVRPSQGANLGAVLLTDAFIAISGIVVSIVAATLGDRIAGVEGQWVRLFGVGWALLSATHGAFAFAADLQGIAVPQVSSTDPRGFATFGLAGLWTFVVGVLARDGRGGLPRGLGTLAVVAGADLVLLYFATLTAQDTLILALGGLASIVLGPLFWVWTGRALSR